MKSIAVLLLIASTAGAITREQIDRLANPAIEVAQLDRVVIGVIDAGGRAVYGYGTPTPDGQTLFEIGSISKVFTATLLAEMASKGEVRLDQPVKELLPRDVKMPSKDGIEITLVHLATHTSGLPRLPCNFEPADAPNPFADYTTQRLYEGLAETTLSHTPGETYDYSNLGAGLLGHALALKHQTSYEQLLIDRICAPLGMNDTRITLDAKLRTRLAAGHDIFGLNLPNWDFDALAGCGAIRSSADDMLIFLAANMGVTQTPLSKAMTITHERRTRVDETNDAGMGWHIARRTGTRWHNGGTGGYRSYAAFVPGKTFGVVVLCNTSSAMVDTLGIQLVKTMLGEPVEPIQPIATTAR